MKIGWVSPENCVSLNGAFGLAREALGDEYDIVGAMFGGGWQLAAEPVIGEALPGQSPCAARVTG